MASNQLISILLTVKSTCFFVYARVHLMSLENAIQKTANSQLLKIKGKKLAASNVVDITSNVKPSRVDDSYSNSMHL